jgi:hypothetical protein
MDWGGFQDEISMLACALVRDAHPKAGVGNCAPQKKKD